MVQGCPSQAELSRFAVGDLSGPVFEHLAGHVENCADCQSILQTLDEPPWAPADPLLKGLRESAGEVAYDLAPVPEHLLVAVQSARSQRSATDWLAGAPPHLLGKFELLEELGQGSFGYVFRARDTELDRTVAIKILRAGPQASRQDIDRFLREARSAAQLKHPGIVSIYDTGQTADGTCYLVEEFVPGTTLAARLQSGPIGFRQSAELVALVAKALDYAHRHGVIHRDIKPSNIMLDQQGRPHLMDFGLAKREADDILMTLDGQILGTPAYMSPELARGESHYVDARSDIYSLSVILYELLSGERPFRGTRRMLMLQVLEDEPRPPRQLNDKIPRDLETICLKAMAKAPARRYATAQELADDLHRFLDGESIRARPVGVWKRGWNWARRRPALAALVGVSVAATVLMVAVLAVSYARIARQQQQTEEALRRETQANQDLLKALIQNARLISDALVEADAYYSEVVERLGNRVEVTHDYLAKKGAIPLPATMSLELGKRITARGSGTQVRMYSDSPFPWRRREGGPTDDFEREALQQLRQQPDQPFYRFEDWRSRSSLRYATARRMQASCINCHNNHKDSPKKDWKEGDVGGVFEVIFPVDSAVAKPAVDQR